MNGLKYFRKISNLSLEDIAKKIGVTRSVISKWERGERNMTRENAKKLEEAFKIPSWYFDDDLDENDMLNLKKIKLQNDIFLTTQQVGEIYVSDDNECLINESKKTNVMIKIQSLSNNIKNYLLPFEVTEYEEDIEDYVSNHEQDILEDIEIISDFITVLSERKVPLAKIRTILTSLKFVYGCNNIPKNTRTDKLLNEFCDVLLKNQ